MWLTINQASKALHLSPTTVRRLIADGELGRVRQEGARVHVHVEAARKYAKVVQGRSSKDLHQSLMVQHVVLLIGVDTSPMFLSHIKRVCTRLTYDLKMESSKARGLALLCFHQARTVMTPKEIWTREEREVLREFSYRLYDFTQLRRTDVWNILTGKGEPYPGPERF